MANLERLPVEELAEEFVARWRKGERPTADEYARRHPEHAAEILDLFPALVMMEDLAPSSAGSESSIPALKPGSAAPPTRIADYRILREVGRGGMGVVYEAEQVSLGRRVALKVLPAHVAGDVRAIARFRRESRAAAQLHHTNIVPVFEVGLEGDVAYFAMQFISGQALDQVLRELRKLKATGATVPDGGPAQSLWTGKFDAPGTDVTGDYTPPPDASAPSSAARLSAASDLSGAGTDFRHYCWNVARIGRQAAEALAHAHQRGIVHRDVKPGNLLLDTAGTVWVTDFGLAKTQDDALTQTGDLIGTIRYMAPERFHGTCDVRADVYSLGLTLYELLTLRPAFAERDRLKLIEQIAHSDPPRPRSLDRRIPADLETVILKAIDKDPGRRYPSAEDLAEDLRRFADDEPIRARRIGPAERAARWARRNPALAGLAAAVVLVTAAGFAATVSQMRVAQRNERDADDRRRDAEASELRMREAEHARRLMLADTFAAFGQVAADRNDPALASLWFANASRLAPEDPGRAENNRLLAGTWTKQAMQPVALLTAPDHWVLELAWHPTGRYLTTYSEPRDGEDGTAVVWDSERQAAWPLPTGVERLTAAAWGPAGQRVALGLPTGRVLVCRFPDGAMARQLDGTERVTSVRWTPDGRNLGVVSGGTLRVVNVETGALAMPAVVRTEPILNILFHPQSDRVLVFTAREPVGAVADLYPIDPVRGSKPINPTPIRVPGGRDTITRKWSNHQPVFIDEGRHIAVPTGRNTLALFSAVTGVRAGMIPLFPAATGSVARSVYQALSVVVSPDDRYAAVLGANQALLVDLAARRVVGAELRHRQLQYVNSADFGPTSRVLATSSSDRTVRLWSAPDGAPLAEPVVLPASVSHIRFSPDGQFLATAQEGGQVRVWRLPGGDARHRDIEVGARTTLAVLSADGRHVMPAGRAQRGGDVRMTRVYDVLTGQPAGDPITPGGVILTAAFSPTEPLIALGLSDPSLASLPNYGPGATVKPGRLRLWNWRTGKERGPGVELPGEPRDVVVAPDGRTAAAVCHDGQVALVDTDTGTLRKIKQVRPADAANNWYINNGRLAYGPGGRTLWTFGTKDNVRAVDADTLEEKFPPIALGDRCHDLHFSPDGRLVSTASWDNVARVWDAETGEPVSDPLRHPDWVFQAPFSPDGTKLLTACRDSTARLWDWRAGRQVIPALEHNHEVHAVAFTPDGRRLLTGSDDETARVWDPGTGKALSRPIQLAGFGLQVLVGVGGRRAVVAGFMPYLQVIDLEGMFDSGPLPADDMVTWGELLSGKRIDGTGPTPLTAGEWEERWRAFVPRHPELLRVPEADALATHRREAQSELASRRWAAAVTHLTALLQAAPRDQSLLLSRGRALAEQDRLADAYSDYKTAADLGRLPDYETHRLVVLASAVGDRAGAGRAIDAWVRSAAGRGPDAGDGLIVWTFALFPDLPMDRTQMSDFVTRTGALERTQRLPLGFEDQDGMALPYYLTYLPPAVAYMLRTGQVEEAFERLNKPLAIPAGFPKEAVGRTELSRWQALYYSDLQSLLAVLHARRGNRSEAEQALKLARERTAPGPKKASPFADGPSVPPWNHRLVQSLLLDEAEKAVAAAGKK